MGVKVYVSTISGDKEIKHRQLTLLQILDAKKVYYRVIDIATNDNKKDKEFVHKNATSLGATTMEPNPVHPLPPQIFNGDNYCGDFDQFEEANENNELFKFLKVVPT